MDISAMHVWFRQYAQQMGMQNVLAILPEQIDLVINTSIADVVNQEVQEHIGLTTEKDVQTNSKVGQINALLPLYKVFEFNLNRNIQERVNNFRIKIDEILSSYLFINSFSLNYLDNNTNVTSLFKCRLIDLDYLSDTLNDFILKPRINSPIAVLHDDTVDIYLGVNKYFIPNKLYVNYIDKPAVVKLGEDKDSSVDCDLPEYLHIPMLKHAVALYKASINGGDNYSQQQVPQDYGNGGNQQI